MRTSSSPSIRKPRLTAGSGQACRAIAGAMAWAMVHCIALVSICRADSRPNFVFIQGEGQGWASTSVQLDPKVPESKSQSFLTPNLERLARGGIRFSNFYAPSPRCTPSRATYFTGLNPAQLRMTFTAAGGDTGKPLIEPRVTRELPAEVLTIAELLKAAGYATAHFGKWHVGRSSPRLHGFDESDGANNNGGPENSQHPNPKQAYGITKRGIDFIGRQSGKGTPFYLQLSHYAGRSQDDAKPETFERALKLGLGRNSRNIGAAAAALDMDITIGMVLDKLTELGITENTYVIYTADHGTPGRNGPLRGGKGGLWDGGIRIPLFIRGPAAKPGSHSSIHVTGSDLVPTIADLAGVAGKVPKEVEGGSLRQLLENPESGKVLRARNELVFHFPHYDKDSLGPVSAIIAGDFKLVRVCEEQGSLLFNLSKDHGERNNLAASMPQKVQELEKRLTDALSAMNAELPKPRSGSAPATAERQAIRQRPGRQKRDAILAAIDEDANGRLTKQELQRLPAILRSLDRDGDGSVSRMEAIPR